MKAGLRRGSISSSLSSSSSDSDSFPECPLIFHFHDFHLFICSLLCSLTIMPEHRSISSSNFFPLLHCYLLVPCTKHLLLLSHFLLPLQVPLVSHVEPISNPHLHRYRSANTIGEGHLSYNSSWMMVNAAHLAADQLNIKIVSA